VFLLAPPNIVACLCCTYICIARVWVVLRVWQCWNVAEGAAGVHQTPRVDCASMRNARATDIIRHSNCYLNLNGHFLYEVKMNKQLCLTV
jgi:hypothetical protein